MNNKGFVLFISLIVIASLIVMVGVYLDMALNERVLSLKEVQKKQAFWLAEAGIERTIKESPLTPVGTGWQEDFDVIKPTWTVDEEIPASWNDIAGPTAILTENNLSAIGRVESESITLNVDTYPNLLVTSTAVDSGCSYTIQIDGTDVITNITQPDTNTANIASAMGWSGVKTFKVGIRITGESKSATFNLIKIKSDTSIAPIINSGPSASPGDDQTTISWMTAEDSNSVVEYGLDATYGFTVSKAELVKDHSVELSDLIDNTPYHFRVRSTDSLGNTVTSADYILSVINKKTLDEGNYKTATMSVFDFNNRWTTVSMGVVRKVDKKIRVVWKQLGIGVKYAMLTEGTLDIKGNASIDGDGDATLNEEGEDYFQNTTLSFQDTFGISKAEMESGATYVYNNPGNNQQPVSDITWVNVDEGGEFKITGGGGWTGSGILVVDGDLQITGGTFNGVIWVVGTLKISGNPVINGAVLVESGAEVDTSVAGNAKITYDENAVNGGFSCLREVLSWKEL